MPRAETLAAAIVILSLSPAVAAAQRQRFDVPAGRLGESVIALGRQAGISIGIRDPAVANLRVRAVRAALTPEEALRRLLRDSGARHIALGPNTFLIVRAPRRQAKRDPVRAPGPPKRRPAPAPVSAAVEPQEEIVVTGSKRALALAAYPGPAEMIEGNDPALAGLRGSEALVERIPGVTSTHLGPGRNKLFLRGIADSSFNGPTQATVGQYLGESRLNYNAPDPDLRLHDIERIEVLPGPQGTLYGAGSLGGVIRIIPRPPDPDDSEAAGSVGASATRHGAPGADSAALLNLPLVDGRLAFRASAYVQREGGYIDDLQRGLEDVNRTHILGGRAALRLRASNRWTVDLALTGQRIVGQDAQFADGEGPPLTRRSSIQEDYRNAYLLADLVVSRRWGAYHLVSATGLARQALTERYDSTEVGGPPRVFEQRNRVTMLSSDTRLSHKGGGGGGWLVGASFVSNRSAQARALGPKGGLRPITGVRNAVVEATLYGEASLRIAEDILLTGGTRLTHARLTGAALDVPEPVALTLRGIAADRSETSFAPSLALSAQPARGLSLFVRYQEGFRPGGLAVTGEVVQRFRNDNVASTEAGLRYRRPGPGGFDAAASLAYTRWKSIQADVIDFAGLPTTANIGDGRIYTLDMRLGWRPIAGLSVDLGGVFNRSRVTNPAPSIIITPTAELPNVAKINARFGAQYEAPVASGWQLRLAGSARYVGKSRLGIGPVLGELQGDWLDTRLSAELETGRFGLSLTLSNLLDEQGNRFAFGSPFTLIQHRQITPLRPRSIRLGIRTRF